MTPKYVPEYDGLRAIAVIGVLLYHVGFAALPGGFVGVDAFFVISGFLISKIIFSEVDQGSFSLGRFYERRFRRIIPALVATLLVSLPVFAALSSPAEVLRLRDTLVAALLSLSNVYFYFTIDYFNSDAGNPFLHTWSLAVEEQFYLFFPVLVMVIAAQRRKLVLGIVALASLVAASIWVFVDASATFYLPWLRAWELLAGTALALAQSERFNERLRRAASWVGPILLIGSMLLLSEKMPFPGLVALPPVLGAALVIAGAGVNSLPNKLLSATGPRWIGKISYSLYLVHWPLISLMAALGFHLVGATSKIVVVAVSIALAAVSYRWVETPFRTPRGKARAFAGTAVALLSLAAVAQISVLVMSHMWERSPNAENLVKAQADPRAHLGDPACFLQSKRDSLTFFSVPTCLQVDPGRRNILVLGDSHSAHFMASIRKLAPEANVLQASASGCVPSLNASGAKRCTDLSNLVLHDWLPKHARSVDLVILSARWEPSGAQDLVALAEHIERLGPRAVVLGPSPEYRAALPKILGIRELYSIDLSDKLLRKERLQLDQMLARTLPQQVAYYSVSAPVCQATSCQTSVAGHPVLFDRDHFTEVAADYVLAGLRPCLSRVADCRSARSLNVGAGH